jgi:hypothetical protein
MCSLGPVPCPPPLQSSRQSSRQTSLRVIRRLSSLGQSGRLLEQLVNQIVSPGHPTFLCQVPRRI